MSTCLLTLDSVIPLVPVDHHGVGDPGLAAVGGLEVLGHVVHVVPEVAGLTP